MSTFQDVVFQWLTTDSIPLNQIDAEDPEVSAKPITCCRKFHISHLESHDYEFVAIKCFVFGIGKIKM